MSSNSFSLTPKHKNTNYTIKEKQQIILIDKLELRGVWHFCLKMINQLQKQLLLFFLLIN